MQKKLVTFDDSLVVKELKKARPIPGERKYFYYVTNNHPQYAFLSLCTLLAAYLLRKGTNVLIKKTRRMEKELELLKRILSVPLKDIQKLPPSSSRLFQVGGPSHATPPEPGSAPQAKSPRNGDKTDK
jgi:hypothetical protein